MAHTRSQRGLSAPPLTGPWALAPALVVLGLVLAAGLGYAVAQSLGALPLTGEREIGLAGYRDLMSGSADLWASAGFTLWISAAATLLAALAALGLIVWLERPRRRRGLAAGLLHVNLAIPHVVWAVILLLLVSQSGIAARMAAAIGLLDDPSEFPVVVRDGYGVGVILHYASKEAPFVALIAYALMRAQPREFGVIADTLGARGWRRVRLFVLPTVVPGITAASALVFAFVFGAYEAPVLLGASSPRALSVLGVDLFNSPDLTDRPAAMALGVLMTLAVTTAIWLMLAIASRRRR